MEAVLEVYQTAYNSKTPVICIDEATKQLVKETRVPIPAAVGQPEGSIMNTNAMELRICLWCVSPWSDGGVLP